MAHPSGTDYEDYGWEGFVWCGGGVDVEGLLEEGGAGFVLVSFVGGGLAGWWGGWHFGFVWGVVVVERLG